MVGRLESGFGWHDRGEVQDVVESMTDRRSVEEGRERGVVMEASCSMEAGLATLQDFAQEVVFTEHGNVEGSHARGVASLLPQDGRITGFSSPGSAHRRGSRAERMSNAPVVDMMRKATSM